VGRVSRCAPPCCLLGGEEGPKASQPISSPASTSSKWALQNKIGLTPNLKETASKLEPDVADVEGVD
jgi:hypothetical protein